VIWQERLYRRFANRRQLAAYAGLAPSGTAQTDDSRAALFVAPAQARVQGRKLGPRRPGTCSFAAMRPRPGWVSSVRAEPLATAAGFVFLVFGIARDTPAVDCPVSLTKVGRIDTVSTDYATVALTPVGASKVNSYAGGNVGSALKSLGPGDFICFSASGGSEPDATSRRYRGRADHHRLGACRSGTSAGIRCALVGDPCSLARPPMGLCASGSALTLDTHPGLGLMAAKEQVPGRRGPSLRPWTPACAGATKRAARESSV
jgi:hypothetical protein